MKVTKTIHVANSILSGPASQIAPDLKITGDNGEEPFLLGFIEQSPDGSQDAHFFALDATGKENVMKHLTGGIIPAAVGALEGLPRMDIPRGKGH